MQARFRTRFDAAVIAVHRRGERVISKIGDIVLHPGDVLLLDTGPNFLNKFREDANFLLMSEVENSTPPRFDKFYIALLAIVMMMVGYLFTSEYMSLFEWSVFATFVMLVSGCLTVEKARKAVNWEVIVTIACAFGLSTALEKTNVARAVGAGLVDLAESTGTGEAGVLSAIYMATFLLSIVVANNAAALLMYPIALQASTTVGIPLERMLYTLMLAASSSFASPFGYQTNLMVFGPGGYTFRDFATFGFPMQFWQMIFSITFLLLNDIWYICWLVAIGVFALTYFGMKYKHGVPSKSNASIRHGPVFDIENNIPSVHGQ
jgi:di/tricarboxylate transporter